MLQDLATLYGGKYKKIKPRWNEDTEKDISLLWNYKDLSYIFVEIKILFCDNLFT